MINNLNAATSTIKHMMYAMDAEHVSWGSIPDFCQMKGDRLGTVSIGYAIFIGETLIT